MLLDDFTYSYVDREPKKGQKGPCCRPTKQKCHQDNKLRNICKTKSGKTKCGAECTRLIQALEGLQKREERKKKRKKEKELEKAKLMQNTSKPGREESESESFEDYNSEEEEYSDEEYQETEKKEFPKQSKGFFRRSEAKPDKDPGGGGMGLQVKKGQKLSQKQLNMLESASQVRETSTNPLCKEKKSNLFRSEIQQQ